jgi:hypothetical protein
LISFSRFVKNIYSISTYEGIAIYSDKPVKINWKVNVLHNDNGKAVEFADGWGWYALNGVMMKPEYVLTPAEKISDKTILSEKNVDMRRELIRKVGLERFIKQGREIDSLGDYKLLDMQSLFDGIEYAPHLLMKNQSLEYAWHLEGVHPDCKTVQEAINWRAGNKDELWQPISLS